MVEQRVDKMADWTVGGKAALLVGWLVAELAVMKAVMKVCLWVDSMKSYQPAGLI